MSYVLPLEDRIKFARVQRDQYRRDPAFRLKRINAARRRRGQPEYQSLDEATRLRLPK